MKRKKIYINHIPAILWGEPSENIYLYIHGQGGNKEEAENIYESICLNGYQILSFDLPEHGERIHENKFFVPWEVVPELTVVFNYANQNWKYISLFANSIGAWFSMLSFNKQSFEQCLMLAPILDMKQLISQMMSWENITEEQLQLEKNIQTSSGEIITWKYWKYVLLHQITQWSTHTKILYGKNDHLVNYKSVQNFSKQFHCELTIFENGEHWFHTKEQLNFLNKWIKNE